MKNCTKIEHLGEPSAGLILEQQWQAISHAAGLSPRETDVARLLFKGHTRQQIADQLSIKTRTVRQHLESLHDKLNVTNRVGVILRIIQIRDLVRIPGEKPIAVQMKSPIEQ